MSESNTPEERKPHITKAGLGHRWLAASVEDCALRFGVLASSEAEAEEKYRESLIKWTILLTEG